MVVSLVKGSEAGTVCFKARSIDSLITEAAARAAWLLTERGGGWMEERWWDSHC